LLAELHVEALSDADEVGSDAWIAAAKATTTAQRRLAVLQARKGLLTAQQAHQVAAARAQPETAKAVAIAEKALAAAEAKAQQPPTTAYVGRPIQTYPQTSTGRRLAFARWIADANNPLTARVAVNHIWLRHFGQALVPRTFEFGRNGPRPTH